MLFSISNFLLAEYRERASSLECTQDINKVVRGRKYVDNDFYWNGSSSEDLEREFKKTLGDALTEPSIWL